MPPKSKVSKHCTEAVNSRWSKRKSDDHQQYAEPYVITSQQAVMGALVSGTSYENFSRGLAVTNIKCGGKT